MSLGKLDRFGPTGLWVTTVVTALGVLAGCGHTTHVRPNAPKELSVEVDLGGPLANLGAPIPLPLTTAGVSYGVMERLDVQAHVHLTTLAFGVAGLDVGSTYLPIREQGAIPAVSLSGRLYGFSDFHSGARGYLELTGAASYLFKERFLTYLSATGFLQMFEPPLLSLAVGEEVKLGHFGLQLEVRWYEPNQLSTPMTVNWVSIGGRGALGVVLGFRYYFELGGQS